MKQEKRTNDSKHSQKSRLNLRQILKDLKKSEDPRKSYQKNRGSKKNRTNLLIQNYYVKQNILAEMIELRLNRKVTNFPLIIKERVSVTADHIVDNSRFKCVKKLLILTKASLIIIYSTTIWTK